MPWSALKEGRDATSGEASPGRFLLDPDALDQAGWDWPARWHNAVTDTTGEDPAHDPRYMNGGAATRDRPTSHREEPHFGWHLRNEPPFGSGTRRWEWSESSAVWAISEVRDGCLVARGTGIRRDPCGRAKLRCAWCGETPCRTSCTGRCERVRSPSVATLVEGRFPSCWVAALRRGVEGAVGRELDGVARPEGHRRYP